MARHESGPRRSDSVESYLMETRAIAAVAFWPWSAVSSPTGLRVVSGAAMRCSRVSRRA
jgi:hypothetical protein